MTHDLFLGFLDEEFEQLRIEVLGILRDNRHRNDFGRLQFDRRLRCCDPLEIVTDVVQLTAELVHAEVPAEIGRAVDRAEIGNRPAGHGARRGKETR